MFSAPTIKGIAKFNRMENLWYIIFLVCLHVYLIYSAIFRYWNYKRLVFNPRFGDNWDEGGMNLYLAFIVVGLVFVPFMLYAAFLRIGNYAADGEQLVRDTDNLELLRLDDTHQRLPNTACYFINRADDRGLSASETGSIRGGSSCIGGIGGSSTSRWANTRKRFPPWPYLAHIMSAFCLLVPLSVLHGQIVVRTDTHKDKLFQSDLSSLFGYIKISDDTENESNEAYSENRKIWIESLHISPEYVNLFIALLQYAMRYPAPFWYTSRSYTALFSVIAVVFCAHVLVDISAASVLHKLAYYFTINSKASPEMTAFEPALSGNGGFFLRQPGITLGLSIFGSFVALILLGLLFEFGYAHFIANLDHMYQAGENISNGSMGGNTLTRGGLRDSGRRVRKVSMVSYEATLDQVPHPESSGMMPTQLMPPRNRFSIVLTALALMLVPGLAKAPIIWECFRLKDHLPLMAGNAMLAIIMVVLWFLLWVGLFIKATWVFRVVVPQESLCGSMAGFPGGHYSTARQHKLPLPGITTSNNNEYTNYIAGTMSSGRGSKLSNGILMSGGMGGSVGGGFNPTTSLRRDRLESSNSSNPIYAMFPEVEEESGTAESQGVNSPDFYSDTEGTEGSSRGGSNYVYLQSDLPPPPPPPEESNPPVSINNVFNTDGLPLPLPEQADEEISDTSFDSNNIMEDPNRPTTGVLKYAVTRGTSFRANRSYSNEMTDSVFDSPPIQQSPLAGGSSSLSRNNRLRKSGNRVTFKETPESIPGSTGSPSGSSGSNGPPTPTRTSSNAQIGDSQSSDDSGTASSDSVSHSKLNGIPNEHPVGRQRSGSLGMEIERLDSFGSCSVASESSNASNGATNSRRSPTYYNQPDFAAADYDPRFAVDPNSVSVTAVNMVSQVSLPVRSPFNSLKRQHQIKEIAPPQDPRLCSQV